MRTSFTPTNLALIAHLEASPSALRLTDRWYSRSYYAMALQNNDIDFRLLVDYTIQELIVDGTLQRLAAPLLLSDDFPAFEIVPGTANSCGYQLVRLTLFCPWSTKPTPTIRTTLPMICTVVGFSLKISSAHTALRMGVICAVTVNVVGDRYLSTKFSVP